MTTLTFLRTALALMMAQPVPATAQVPIARVLQSLPGSSLMIRGSTSVGVPWHCGSSTAIATAEVEDLSPGDSITRLVIRSVDIRVPVAELRCQGGRMERAMRHALKADVDSAAGVIVGRFAPRTDAPINVDGTVDLVGTLRVAGSEQPVVLHAAVTRGENHELLVHSEVPLTLSMFSITPPSVLFGAVHARDAITVQVDLRYPEPLRADRARAACRTVACR